MATHEINYNLGALGRADVMKVRALTINKGMDVYVGGNDVYTKVYIPPALVDYTPYFMQLTDKSVIKEDSFPQLWQRNQEMMETSLKNSMQRVLAVENNTRLFYSSLRSEVFEGTLPYHQYLPSKAVDYIYVGEVHENPLIQEELVNLLAAVKRLYPSRNVYLATEYVWESLERTLLRDAGELPLAIAHDKKELRAILEDEQYVSYQFLHQAINMGIPVVGLEPRVFTAEYSNIYGSATTPMRKAYERRSFATSELGMDMRNERWVKHIQQIRAQDPNALVVVHGGAQHTSFHTLNSVANKLGGESFSVMLLDWRAKDITNPVLATMDDQRFLWRQFEQASDGKYVLSFKEADPSVGRTPKKLDEFKHSLGANMIVFLKDMSPMIDP